MRVKKPGETCVFGWAKRKNGVVLGHFAMITSDWTTKYIAERVEYQTKGAARHKCIAALKETGLGKVHRFRGGSRTFVGTCDFPDDVFTRELLKHRINPNGTTDLHNKQVRVEIRSVLKSAIVNVNLYDGAEREDYENVVGCCYNLNFIEAAAQSERSPADEALRAAKLVNELIGRLIRLIEQPALLRQLAETTTIKRQLVALEESVKVREEELKEAIGVIASPLDQFPCTKIE